MKSAKEFCKMIEAESLTKLNYAIVKAELEKTQCELDVQGDLQRLTKIAIDLGKLLEARRWLVSLRKDNAS